MRRLLLLALVPAVLLGVRPAAQEPAQKPSQDPSRRARRARDTPIFRLTVSLVQLDVVVTDGKGRHVTTLGPEDFEVYQDGRQQPVTAVSTWTTRRSGKTRRACLPCRPRRCVPRDARRAMAIVVDDLRMSFESIYYSRRGLQRFLDREFQQGDLAMLVTTSGLCHGPELTFSPKVLRAAVNRLRFSLWDIRPASMLDPIDIGGRSGFGSVFDRISAAQLRPVSSIERKIDAVDRRAEAAAGPQVRHPGVGRLSRLRASAWTTRSCATDAAARRSREPGRRCRLCAGSARTGLHRADRRRRRRDPGPMGRDVGSMRSAALRESQDGLRYLAERNGRLRRGRQQRSRPAA